MTNITAHTLKCWPVQFHAVVNGLKPFELRLIDREFKVGDILILEEYDPSTENSYTGLSCSREITYILKDFAGLQPGFCIMGLKPW